MKDEISFETPRQSFFLHKIVTEKTPEERIKELELKLSAVSEENKTLKQILYKEQQLKESMNQDPSEEGSYFL